jgi:hypothetical protein
MVDVPILRLVITIPTLPAIMEPVLMCTIATEYAAEIGFWMPAIIAMIPMYRG